MAAPLVLASLLLLADGAAAPAPAAPTGPHPLVTLLTDPVALSVLVPLLIAAVKGTLAMLGMDRAAKRVEQVEPALSKAALVGASTVAGIHALRRSGQVDAVTMRLVLAELQKSAAAHGAGADLAAIVERVKGGEDAVDAIRAVVTPPPAPGLVAGVVRRVTGKVA